MSDLPGIEHGKHLVVPLQGEDDVVVTDPQGVALG
jgi:hypothetical protein